MNYCQYCNGFGCLINFGCRSTKNRGKIQRFKCKKCKRTFVADDGFKHRHKSKKTILDSLLLALKLSMREVSEFIQISKNTVLNWITHYTKILYKFLQNRVQMSCNVLHMDELFLRMGDTFYYLWDSICKDTRFSYWFLSERRTKDNAKCLMRISAKPKKLITDGSFSYIQPVKEVFGIPWFYKNYHRCETFEDKKHNNLVERLQNTLRRYLHLRRGFYNTDTGNLFLQFLWIYYNFIRKHMAIRCTPAEKAGVICFANGIREYDRMLELIER